MQINSYGFKVFVFPKKKKLLYYTHKMNGKFQDIVIDWTRVANIFWGKYMYTHYIYIHCRLLYSVSDEGFSLFI
jgi:hypothetical protein